LCAAAAKAGVDLPERQAFHIFCHPYATLLRRYGKLDLWGLIGPGRCKDIKSRQKTLGDRQRTSDEDHDQKGREIERYFEGNPCGGLFNGMSFGAKRDFDLS
jgi:hypothetical protein